MTSMAGCAMENSCFGGGQRAGLGMEGAWFFLVRQLRGGGRRKWIPRLTAQRAQKYGHEVVCGACNMREHLVYSIFTAGKTQLWISGSPPVVEHSVYPHCIWFRPRGNSCAVASEVPPAISTVGDSAAIVRQARERGNNCNLFLSNWQKW